MKSFGILMCSFRLNFAVFLDVTQVDASGNAMGTSAAKAFGDMLLVNKTIQHLNVSNNSFGEHVVGDQVKLKSSGEVKDVRDVNPDGRGQLRVYPEDFVNPEDYVFESQVPAFCAGLAASTSLLSVCVSV